MFVGRKLVFRGNTAHDVPYQSLRTLVWTDVIAMVTAGPEHMPWRNDINLILSSLSLNKKKKKKKDCHTTVMVADEVKSESFPNGYSSHLNVPTSLYHD